MHLVSLCFVFCSSDAYAPECTRVPEGFTKGTPYGSPGFFPGDFPGILFGQRFHGWQPGGPFLCEFFQHWLSAIADAERLQSAKQVRLKKGSELAWLSAIADAEKLQSAKQVRLKQGSERVTDGHLSHLRAVVYR